MSASSDAGRGASLKVWQVAMDRVVTVDEITPKGRAAQVDKSDTTCGHFDSNNIAEGYGRSHEVTTCVTCQRHVDRTK